MKLKLQYLWIEIKKTLKIFPRMLLQAVLLILLIGTIAFCDVKSTEQNPLAVNVDIAVVVREENMMTKMALSYVEEMESVSQICSFRQMTEDEGFGCLERGEVAALILLPEQLVEGIMNGANPTVDIYFPRHAGLEALLFRELTASGEGLLRVAQAQIYGAGDTVREYGLTDRLSGIEAEIDSYNLAFALDRLALYDDKNVSAFGSMSSVQFYLASGMVLFLLLVGMAMYPIVQSEPAAFRRQLERQGIGRIWQSFCQWVCAVLCIGVFFGILCIVVRLAAVLLGPDAVRSLTEYGTGEGSAGSRMGLAVLIIISIGTIIYLLHRLAGSRTSGILLVFVFSVGMVYLSGGLIPSMFLTEGMQAAGQYLPTTYLMQAAGGFLTGRITGATGQCAAVLCGYTAIFGGIAFLKNSCT